MKKLLSVVMAAMLSLGTVAGLASCTDDNTGDKKEPVVGLICLHGESSTYDKNFIVAFKDACAAKGLTADQYTIVTDIPESVECYEKAAELADAGCKAVFADSFGHESHMMKAAEEFPDVEFCHATGTQAHLATSPANYHNAFADIYQGRFLAGVAAGLKLQEMKDAGELEGKYDADGNVKIGYVGAWTYAEVISGYTSFYLGVKSVFENVVMDVQFTGSWYDETAEKTTAEALIERGCVLISQHADSMGAPTACEEANVPNVSYNGSTVAQCPDTFIVSSRINWQPYFEYMISAVLNDTEIVADKCGTIEDGSVVLTEVGPAAAEGTQAKLDEVKAKLVSGEIKVFDTTTFTVTVVKEGDNQLNANATVDANGYLTEYLADVDGDFVGEVNVVANGYFDESGANFRSAPYFDLQIDGINLLNVKF